MAPRDVLRCPVINRNPMAMPPTECANEREGCLLLNRIVVAGSALSKTAVTPCRKSSHHHHQAISYMRPFIILHVLRRWTVVAISILSEFANITAAVARRKGKRSCRTTRYHSALHRVVPHHVSPSLLVPFPRIQPPVPVPVLVGRFSIASSLVCRLSSTCV